LLFSEAQAVASQAKKNIGPEKSHRGLQGNLGQCGRKNILLFIAHAFCSGEY